MEAPECKPQAPLERRGSRLDSGAGDRRLRVARAASYTQISAGDVAQLGERCVRNAEVGGSSPPISTRPLRDYSTRSRESTCAAASGGALPRARRVIRTAARAWSRRCRAAGWPRRSARCQTCGGRHPGSASSGRRNRPRRRLYTRNGRSALYRSWFLGHFTGGNHAATPVVRWSASRTAVGVR